MTKNANPNLFNLSQSTYSILKHIFPLRFPWLNATHFLPNSIMSSLKQSLKKWPIKSLISLFNSLLLISGLLTVLSHISIDFIWESPNSFSLGLTFSRHQIRITIFHPSSITLLEVYTNSSKLSLPNSFKSKNIELWSDNYFFRLKEWLRSLWTWFLII